MAKPKMKTKSEGYVDTPPGVRGGAPVIAGTGFKVLDVAVRYEVMGMTPEEIMVALPHLELSQIHAALSYYEGSEKISRNREHVRERVRVRKTVSMRKEV